MGPKSSWRGPNKIAIQVFISHSTDDRLLALKLAKLLELALDMPKAAIRNTSSDEHELEPGDRVPDALKKDLQECLVVIALMTRDSVVSGYVLMELGATWAVKETACLLLAPGVSLADLPGPLQSLHATKISGVGAMSRVLASVADSTGLKFKEDQPEVRAALADFERYVKGLSHRRPWFRRTAPIGALAALAAGIFAYLVWTYSHPRYPIVLFTGTQGGQFNKLGEWLQEAMAAQNVALQVKATPGSVYNCLQMEIAEANTVALAWTSQRCGATKEHPNQKARVVAALFPEVLHFLVHKDSDSPGALPNLRGKKVYVGAEGSGTRLSVERLLSNSGYDAADVTALMTSNPELTKCSFDDAAVLLQAGKINAAFFGTGLKAPAVYKALATGKVRLVSLPTALIENMSKGDPDRHFAYASLEKDEQLKAAYEPNTYGLNSSGYQAPNPEGEKASSYRYNSYTSDAVLMAPESVDQRFVQRLLKTLLDPDNRKTLVNDEGVSEAYLDNNKVLNERMMNQKDIVLHSCVTDALPLWMYQSVAFVAGMLLVFAVTVGSVDYFQRRVRV
jgi:TRAP transporter TAXI family solute receptor